MADILKNQIIINAATPVNKRRIADGENYIYRGRTVSFNPKTGTVRFKVSHDGGLTYDLSQEFTGEVKTGGIKTYGQLLEFECTGDAVLTLSK